MRNAIEHLPRTAAGTRKGRLFVAFAATLVACLAAMAIGVATQTAPLAFGAFGAVFLLAFAALPVALVVNAQAGRALEEMRRTSDPQARVAWALRLVRIGTMSDPWIEAWLVLARFHEQLSALAYAEEALVRAQRAPAGRGRKPSPRLLALVHFRLAFVRAALGRVDEAERMLYGASAADPSLRGAYTRAAAMVAYKRGRFRDVVDLAASSHAEDERDRALFYALEQSSLLRLAGGSPERAAEAPHDEWMERLVPELRARQ
ncbi:MAG TPA: hypothetical protein VIF62_03395 [Labilithrix sp.]|jgi:tetratricopeptide (TPR) repeat protein